MCSILLIAFDNQFIPYTHEIYNIEYNMRVVLFFFVYNIKQNMPPLASHLIQNITARSDLCNLIVIETKKYKRI